jgi:alcohol dehydrogenase class IV
MQFDFATASRILFGPGMISALPAAAAGMGRHALLVTRRSVESAVAVLEHLGGAGVACTSLPVFGEPTVDLVRSGAALARAEQCDLVISFGGGSAIDAGKAIAALLANGGDPLDYLEVVGRGAALERPSVPFIAVPTTAGSGTEVTRNAVLASPGHRVKASLRSPHLLPRLALVDPELTLGLPPAVTAATGLDALTQLIEPYVSLRANPMTDLFCLEGIRRVARSLRAAWTDGHDAEARADMSMAGLLGGLALANAGLGAVHGFAAPIGGAFPAPHGAVCAALLPHVMEANLAALRLRAPGAPALARYGELAGILTGKPGAAAEEGIEWVLETCRLFEIPPLAAYGLTADDVPALVGNAARASSMKANPVLLTAEELAGVLARALR